MSCSVWVVNNVLDRCTKTQNKVSPRVRYVSQQRQRSALLRAVHPMNDVLCTIITINMLFYVLTQVDGEVHSNYSHNDGGTWYCWNQFQSDLMNGKNTDSQSKSIRIYTMSCSTCQITLQRHFLSTHTIKKKDIWDAVEPCPKGWIN